MFLKTANYVIYIYLAMCGCMLIFNLVSVLRRRRSLLIDKKRCKQWALVFNKIQAGESVRLDLLSMLPYIRRQTFCASTEAELLQCLLSHLPSLNAFHMEIDGRLPPHPEGEALLNWLKQNKAVFVSLSVKYYKKDDTIKAYYAYIMGQFRLAGPDEHDPITEKLLLMVTSSSLFLRENALMGLYASGSEAVVVRGLIRMAEAGIHHGGKLITDGLLTFSGDKDALAEGLWQEWEHFPPAYQIAIISFFRMASGAFTERLLPLLTDRETDWEVQLSILRYYRRYPYESALPVLMEFMEGSNREFSGAYTLAALAASALESYPCDETVACLAKALCHRNWYVRNNAAEAILKIAPDHPVIDEVLNGSDPYARDILAYKMEIMERREADELRKQTPGMVEQQEILAH